MPTRLQLRPNRWLYIGHRLWIRKAAATSAPATAGAPAAIAVTVPHHDDRSAYRNPGSTLVCGDSHADQGRAACGDPHGRGHRDQASGDRGRTTTQPAIGIVVTTTKPTAPPPTSTPPSLAGWPADVLTLTNEERVAAGVPPLVWSPVPPSAQAHATTARRRGWGSHVGSDGALVQTRSRAEWAMRDVGQRDLGQGPLRRQAIAMRWNEPVRNDPDRRNILAPDDKEIGIGVAAEGWGYYFIVDFGSR